MIAPGVRPLSEGPTALRWLGVACLCRPQPDALTDWLELASTLTVEASPDRQPPARTSRALDAVLAPPPLKMHEPVHAPPLCHVPGPDPESATFRRSEIIRLVPRKHL